MPDNCWFALRIKETGFIKFCLKKINLYSGMVLNWGRIDWFTTNMT